MIEKVKQALQNILDRFESGDIPEAIAYSTFPEHLCWDWYAILDPATVLERPDPEFGNPDH